MSDIVEHFLHGVAEQQRENEQQADDDTLTISTNPVESKDVANNCHQAERPEDPGEIAAAQSKAPAFAYALAEALAIWVVDAGKSPTLNDAHHHGFHGPQYGPQLYIEASSLICAASSWSCAIDCCNPSCL